MKIRTNPCAFVTAALTALPLSAFLAPSAAAQSETAPSGVVDDWTFHHLVYSNPGTLADAVRTGTVNRWWGIVNDPRYQMERRRSRLPQRPLVRIGSDPINNDWSQAMTTAGVAATLTLGVGATALSSSSIGSGSSLTVDGVTFTASAPTSEKATITFSGSSAPANTSTVTIGSVTYTFETSSTAAAPATGCQVFSAASATGATSLYDAITFTGTQGGTNYFCASSIAAANAAVTASRSSATITLTAATAGSTGFPFTSTGATHLTLSSTAGTNGTASTTAFPYWSGAAYVSTSTLATNIATALNSNTTVSAVMTASANTPASGNVTLTAKTAGVNGNVYQVTSSGFSAVSPSSGYLSGGSAGVQPNAYPAKFSFSASSASCSDYVVYPTGAPGAANAANIVAYTNLYSGGCTTGTVPSVSWAYNTGGTVTTSPILSADGAQVAFIQVSGVTASLVLLKWASPGGTAAAPVTLTAQSSASNYRNCTAPCYYSLSLGANDTLSAPFYDYFRDELYVGDDAGNLHRFTGAFHGNPAELTTSWPVHLGANKVSSPVYDSELGFQAGYVFVGDMGGGFYSVGSGYAGTTSGTIYGNTGSLGDAIADAPLVDCPQGVEYVFVTTNGSYSETGYNAVWEFVSIFTVLVPPGSSSSPGVVPVGVGGAGYYLYAGAFDNVYFQSSPPSYAATGNLYVAGNTATAGGGTLYRVPISLSSLTGQVYAVATGLNATEHPFPSPVTEFCNGACASNGTQTTSGTDYVFFSVNRGAAKGCTNAAGNGCILSYNIDNPSAVSQSGSGLNVKTPGTNGCWATGGIVIDNLSATAGASQIYFVDMNGATAGGPTGPTSANCTAAGAGINAVQAAQASP